MKAENAGFKGCADQIDYKKILDPQRESRPVACREMSIIKSDPEILLGN
jgi:hypothetical protein